MFSRLLLLFILVPLLELALLIEIGQRVGVWPTIALVVGTGFAGAALARWQGFLVLGRIQDELRNGHIPAGELLDGLLILAGGLLLLTPGLLTDMAGFSMLIPGTRQRIRQWLRRKFADMVARGETELYFYH